MKITKKTLLSCIALAASLSACGGGSSDSPTPTPTFNYQAAATKIYQTGQNVQFTATQTGNVSCKGSGSFFQSPYTTATTFNTTPTQSVSALSGTVAITLNWTNCIPASQIIASTNYLSASGMTPLGFSGPGSYGVFSVSPIFPTSVSVGDSGPMGTLQIYSNNSETTRIGYQIAQYAVTAGSSSSSVTVTTTTEGYSASNILLTRVTEVGQLSSAGTFTATSMTIANIPAGNIITLTGN